MARTIIMEITDIEARLKLPEGFYLKLLEEDDWSFVIKLSSLFEGACTEVLSAQVNCPEMNDILARMDMAAPKGKIETLKKFGSLTDDQAKILKAIAELRNELVHKISNVGFQFSRYFEDMPPSKVDQQIKLFGHGLVDQLMVGTRKVPRAEFVRNNIKYSLWMTAAEVLACLHLDFRSVELRLNDHAMQQYEKITLKFAALDGLQGLLTTPALSGLRAENSEGRETGAK